jgi:hypothetical protein
MFGVVHCACKALAKQQKSKARTAGAADCLKRDRRCCIGVALNDVVEVCLLGLIKLSNCS